MYCHPLFDWRGDRTLFPVFIFFNAEPVVFPHHFVVALPDRVLGVFAVIFIRSDADEHFVHFCDIYANVLRIRLDDAWTPSLFTNIAAFPLAPTATFTVIR